MHLDTPEIREIVSRAFPNYTGKHFRVEPFQGSMYLRSYWSGGSRDYWCAVNLANGAAAHVPENGSGFTADITELKELPPNTALVLHRVGPYSHCTVYVHPENLNRFALPAPANLSRDEKIVLAATVALKSSYAGIKNYRFHEATERTGITLEQWDAAKLACISKGFLNKAGAITDSGRNAIADVRLDSLKGDL